MKREPVQRTITDGLIALLQQNGLSRRQVTLAAVALLAVLYAGLFSATQRTQASSAPQSSAPQEAVPQQQAPTAESSAEMNTPPDPAPAADETGALDDDFLREYDRLSGGAEAAQSPDAIAAEDSSSLVGTLTFALLLVVGLIYGGIWLYKKVGSKQGGGSLLAGGAGGGGALTVQETQSLGPTGRLHIVRLGEETLLLGATDQTITLLARYGADGLAEIGAAPASFADHLQGAMAGQTKKAAAPAQPTAELTQPSLQQSLDQLRRVQQTRRGGGDA